MYTSTIGRRLVDIYNRRLNTTHDAKGFFENVFHPLFYGSDRYMLWATNSPFVQGFKAKSGWTGEQRQLALDELSRKIEAGDRDASIALGYPASESKKFASTSGQVTDLAYEVSADDAYFAWFGAALGIGVAGGYVMLIEEEDIIWDTFSGWQDYRRKLEDPVLDKLPANKVNSWNGRWLYYKYKSRRVRDRPTLSDLDIGLDKKEAAYEIKPLEWSRLLFALSGHFKLKVTFLTAVFGLGQTNKTVGFFPMLLQSGRTLINTYQQLFGEENYIQRAATFEMLYGRHIKRACELGSIGLQALRPQGLEKYLQDPSKTYKLKPGDDAGLSQYFIYKTWITTMLNKNKEEVSDISREFAEALVQFRLNTTKTDRKNLIEKELLQAGAPGKFLTVLATITKEADESQLTVLRKFRDQAHFTSVQDFRYFTTLLKFDYTYAERMADSAASS